MTDLLSAFIGAFSAISLLGALAAIAALVWKDVIAQYVARWIDHQEMPESGPRSRAYLP
jgi:hypothetical protein